MAKWDSSAAAPSCLPLSYSRLHPMPTLQLLTLLMRWSAGPAGRWGYGHRILERGQGKHQRKMLNLSYKILPRATTCKNSVSNMESSNETQTKNECFTVAHVYGNLNRIWIRLLCENCINLNYVMLFRSTVFFLFSVHSFYSFLRVWYWNPNQKILIYLLKQL